MQALKLTLAGGVGTVKAPCVCETVDIMSLTATFNFQYADANGVGQGDSLPATPGSGTFFSLRADNGGKGFCWAGGQTIGFISGGGATDVITIAPRVLGR